MFDIFYLFRNKGKEGNGMTIISNKEQRLISLLNFLNSQKRLSVLKLTQMLNCSKSTILNDLNYFSKNWSDLIHIQITKDQLVEMESSSNGNTNKIIRDIIVNSLEIQFIKLLFLTPHQNVFYYAEKLYTSPATLYRVIKKLKKDLKLLGITIENQNKTYQLVSSNELNLFLFISKGLEEFYGLEIPMNSSEEEFKEFSSLYNYKLEEEHYFMYLIWGVIQHNNINNSQNTMVSFDLFKETYDNIPLTPSLDNYIDEFLEEIGDTFLLCSNVSTKLNAILSFCKKKETLFPLHQYLFINRHQSFVENYAKSNVVPFNRLKKSLEHLLAKLNMDINFSFDLALYLLLTNCRLTLKKNQNKHIYIYSDLGLNHAKFIKQSVVAVFADNALTISTVNRQFFDNYHYQTSDLIISTIFISNQIPTIFVDDYLCSDHYFRIRKELKLIH